MKQYAKRICAVLLAALTLLPFLSVFAVAKEGEGETAGLGISAKSAILMEAETGEVLFEQNADLALPPASVTKIMTLLLVMEALESGAIALNDHVPVSARAAAMGGSQVFLKEGEQMTVEEMIKCVVIASANDCAVALAEFVAGSEAAFVEKMNGRAAELGMANTHFENTNGLDDTVENHLTSARDIALMSRALIAYPKILEYSGIWMDTIRDGSFGLTNTNRLVRFYRGCTGLKTGSTAKAGFCVSATAKRDGLSLIAVIMGAESRDVRNKEAAALLDFGFANFSLYTDEGGAFSMPIKGGTADSVMLTTDRFCCVVPKGATQRVKRERALPDAVSAPLAAGERVGECVYTLDGKELGRTEILAVEAVDRIELWQLFLRLLAGFTLKRK